MNFDKIGSVVTPDGKAVWLLLEESGYVYFQSPLNGEKRRWKDKRYHADEVEKIKEDLVADGFKIRY